jgi:hypothetical protein
MQYSNAQGVGTECYGFIASFKHVPHHEHEGQHSRCSCCVCSEESLASEDTGTTSTAGVKLHAEQTQKCRVNFKWVKAAISFAATASGFVVR